MSIAICPGSYDPVTLGHLDIITRTSRIFDHVIVAVMINPNKKTSFTVEERIDLLRRATEGIPGVEVVGFTGLLADYAHRRGATAIVKGLRAVTDFEYEFQMALTNKKLAPDVETLFMTTRSEYMYLSSSMVKQVAMFGGDISEDIPACILEDVKKRICCERNSEQPK
ncbi:MAG: pantetheine-phosphate adenylyltransferase [Clostridia bacterium]|nr:pantetheine-phosphate adenylyltransferase [Clostridia bacterium]MDD7483466.1 pantetheine-phosphate adenylyltransferase [Clostridia bacterium]MDY5559232.1 pantetheine-phosphate adenylyltransferase [Candidatus Heritagella sp.]